MKYLMPPTWFANCRYRFAALLQGPQRCGMSCDIDMKESAATVLDDHKHIEHAEGRRDHHAEVTCHDASGVIADTREPALRRTAFAWTADTTVANQSTGRAKRGPCE